MSRRKRSNIQRMPKRQSKKVPAVRIHILPLWLFCCIAVLVFYGYYWFVYLSRSEQDIFQQTTYQEQEIDEPSPISQLPDDEDVLYEEPYGVTSEEKASEAVQEWDIQSHLLTDIDISEQPDIYQIMHTSRLIALEQKALTVETPQKNLEAKDVVADQREKLPRIAIVIDDMGASPMRTNEIIALKAPLTSSFVTFASQLTKQVAQARQSGHEIMIHVPMQPKSNIYVSKDVLNVDMTQEQIAQGFEKMLAKFDKVVGVNNHMGSRFTEHAEKLAPVMKLLAEHGLFFLDSKTTPHSQGEATARQYGVPTVHRHVFLDNENNLEYILKQLEQTENVARKNGFAIAIGHPKSQTSKALSVWLKTLDGKKIRLVHLSELVYNSQKSVSE